MTQDPFVEREIHDAGEEIARAIRERNARKVEKNNPEIIKRVLVESGQPIREVPIENEVEVEVEDVKDVDVPYEVENTKNSFFTRMELTPDEEKELIETENKLIALGIDDRKQLDESLERRLESLRKSKLAAIQRGPLGERPPEGLTYKEYFQFAEEIRNAKYQAQIGQITQDDLAYRLDTIRNNYKKRVEKRKKRKAEADAQPTLRDNINTASQRLAKLPDEGIHPISEDPGINPIIGSPDEYSFDKIVEPEGDDTNPLVEAELEAVKGIIINPLAAAELKAVGDLQFEDERPRRRRRRFNNPNFGVQIDV